MSYVSGFVAAVPTANRSAYVEHAAIALEFFKEHGALSVMEAWGVDVPDGETTSFPMAVRAREDETVVLSWIVWPSREVADRAMRGMGDDPRFAGDGKPMPFDGRRLIWGGFEPVLEG